MCLRITKTQHAVGVSDIGLVHLQSLEWMTSFDCMQIIYLKNVHVCRNNFSSGDVLQKRLCLASRKHWECPSREVPSLRCKQPWSSQVTQTKSTSLHEGCSAPVLPHSARPQEGRGHSSRSPSGVARPMHSRDSHNSNACWDSPFWMSRCPESSSSL